MDFNFYASYQQEYEEHEGQDLCNILQKYSM